MVDLVQQAKAFVQEYLKQIRYDCSTLPVDIQSMMPPYWTSRYQIHLIYSTYGGGLAIDLHRPIKKTKDSFIERETILPIEQEIFTGFNYSPYTGGIFGLGNRSKLTIVGINIVTDGKMPFFRMGQSSEVRLVGVGFDSDPILQGHYPTEKDLSWMFSNATEAMVSLSLANEAARSDFQDVLPAIIFAKYQFLLSKTQSVFAIEFVLKRMKGLLNEFRSLIGRMDLQEQILQDFIARHYFLLSPEKAPKIEKRQVGPYSPDFILSLEDGSQVLVELQLNNDRLITSQGSLSAGLDEAVAQLRAWFQWIEKKDPDKLSKTRGIIVIGRSRDYQINQDKINNAIASVAHPVKLLTYDDLTATLESIISSFETRIATLLSEANDAP